MKFFSFGNDPDPEKKPLLSAPSGIFKATVRNEAWVVSESALQFLPFASYDTYGKKWGGDPCILNVCHHTEIAGSKSTGATSEKKKSPIKQILSWGEDWKTPQHIAALAATLGVLITGTTRGWSAPVMFKITKANSTDYDFDVSSSQSDWISSIVTLGSAIIGFPIGLTMDRIGRKATMLLLTIPLTLGWLLITFATRVDMLIVGRFLTGAGAGAFYVTAPVYVSEIAQDSNRGNLGNYFQLMINIGTLFSYTVGGYSSVFVLNIMCTAIPIIFGIILLFMPESPNFLVVKCRSDEAKESLIWLRSSSHNVDNELNHLKFKAEKSKTDHVSYRATFTKRSDIKALTICLSLVFFHQLCGIIAITFNVSQIFFDAGITISTEMATVIIALIQVGVAFASSFVMDILGRRILLLISSLSMCICTTAFGAYFFLLQSHGHEAVEDITWLPLVALSVFVFAFTMGLGPIPWIMVGDLCRIDIKAFVGATASTLNSLLAFAVASSFHPLNTAIGSGQVYWIFAGLTFLGFVFIFFFVPETKGKSIDEIQIILGDEPEEISR